jgi:N-acetylglutamate synthase-like GNAT family acetyltransferase
MIVRHATPFDIPALIDLLKEYRSHTPLKFLSEADDEKYITAMLTEIISGKGVGLVAENGEVFGMLIASIHPSQWSPKHLLMTELAYWVEPEYRGGTAGHRLLAMYVQEAKQLKESGRICNFFISKMVNSPDLSYGKLGFEKLEEFWVI